MPRVMGQLLVCSQFKVSKVYVGCDEFKSLKGAFGTKMDEGDPRLTCCW
jgi:hypothetical protein